MFEEKNCTNALLNLLNRLHKQRFFTFFLCKKLAYKSKGKEINYNNLFQCQGYLLPNNMLNLKEQREIFSYRARMNRLKYNFSGSNNKELCECKSEMTNSHLYECLKLNGSIKNVPYIKIFENRLCEMKSILNILQENQETHDKFTQAQDNHL